MSQALTPICAQFNRQAAHYGNHAPLQRAVAWRLAHHAAALALPEGARADLGAGTGLLGLALQQQAPHLTLMQVDGSPELLSRNPLALPAGQRSLLWNLEQGMPPSLHDCSLLTSSFSLQWLSQPAVSLGHWATALAPGGWLVLAVPVAGSFPQWHEAAARAGVTCTALPLPEAEALIAAAAGLHLTHSRSLWFSRHYGTGGRPFLNQLRRLGAGSSSQPPLSAGQWRRLLKCWPASPIVSWRVLVLIGQRPTTCP